MCNTFNFIILVLRFQFCKELQCFNKTIINQSGIKFGLPAAAMCMVGHLAMLRVMWSLLALSLLASMTHWSSGFVGTEGLLRATTVMSSTKLQWSPWCSATLFTIARKMTGPSLVPWGTPHVTSNQLEVVPLTLVRCLRPDKKSPTHGSSSQRTPIWRSLWSATVIWTRSNAFAVINGKKISTQTIF